MSTRGLDPGNYNNAYNVDLKSLSTSMNYLPNNPPYVRPSDWPALPDISAGTQKAYILYAVYPGTSNWAAVQCSGAYTVDWGDGVTNNTATGTVTNHTYDYTNGSLNPVTSRGYKTALITITPQAGQNLTSVNMSVKPTVAPGSTASGQNNYALDIKVNLPNATSIVFCTSSYPANLLEQITLQQNNLAAGGSSGWNNNTWAHARNLRQIVFKDGPTPLGNMGSSSADQVFVNCNSLHSFVYDNNPVMKPGTWFTNEFRDNWAWVEGPWVDFSTVTRFDQAFAACRSMVKLPAYDLSNVQNMDSSFSGCSSLVEIPNFNTSKVTNLNSTFLNCVSLNKIPRWDTANVTSMGSTFQGCTSLKEINIGNDGVYWDTSKVTVMNGIFASCASLKSVTLGNTANNTNTASMFQTCSVINSVPSFDTANVTNMASMFQSCTLLQDVPTYNTNKVTNMSNMFNGCSKLRVVPAFNCANVTTMTNMLNACPSLTDINLANIKVTFGIPAASLTSDAANVVLTNLQSVSTAQTFALSTNPGIDALVSKTSVSSTAGSTTLTLTNTVGLSVGMVITGANVNNARTCTANVDTVTLTAHGLVNNTMVSFNNANVTGTANQPVYVANAATDTFQVSLTPGGSAITFVANSTPTVQYGRYISNIVANTSITMSTPAGATGTGTITFRVFDTTLATLKGWTVSG